MVLWQGQFPAIFHTETPRSNVLRTNRMSLLYNQRGERPFGSTMCQVLSTSAVLQRSSISSVDLFTYYRSPKATVSYQPDSQLQRHSYVFSLITDLISWQYGRYIPVNVKPTIVFFQTPAFLGLPSAMPCSRPTFWRSPLQEVVSAAPSTDWHWH